MSSSSRARLIVVSNRVPAEGDSPGGLAVALKDALATRETLWFGWSGEIAHTDARADDLSVRTVKRGRVEYAVTPLIEDEHEGYYAGYSNRALWPSFHYRLDLSVFSEHDFSTYMQVNQRFARLLAERIRPGDQIWIHDYHLIPLAHALRALGMDNPIGFFTHIPFPSPEIFRAIPQHETLAQGLTACDLIGFQSERDRDNFERYLDETGQSAHGARAKAFPIGIDADAFLADAVEEGQKGLEDVGGAKQKLILGVDRMDYSKGLAERMRAFEQMLLMRPDLCEATSLVQVTPPSRSDVDAYARLKIELDTLVGRINGALATIDWTPIHYLAQSLPRERLAGLYRSADVGLVTPLRDGMNLVAKEYVAAQDEADPGVLVLSEFAGAAEQLDGALIVNPHDIQEQARAIAHALEMPLAERQERHRAMMRVLRERDADWWCGAFLDELSLCGEARAASAPESVAEPAQGSAADSVADATDLAEAETDAPEIPLRAEAPRLSAFRSASRKDTAATGPWVAATAS